MTYQGYKSDIVPCMCTGLAKDSLGLGWLSHVSKRHSHKKKEKKYTNIIFEISPDNFLMNDSRSNRRGLLRKP